MTRSTCTKVVAVVCVSTLLWKDFRFPLLVGEVLLLLFCREETIILFFKKKCFLHTLILLVQGNTEREGEL